jgi:hypothetical protein
MKDRLDPYYITSISKLYPMAIAHLCIYSESPLQQQLNTSVPCILSSGFVTVIVRLRLHEQYESPSSSLTNFFTPSHHVTKLFKQSEHTVSFNLRSVEDLQPNVASQLQGSFGFKWPFLCLLM